MVPEYARFLKERGVTGVFVAGSTGEGVSCTVAERNLLYAAWAQAARPLGLRAIAMVGALAFEDIKALIGGAEAAAVDEWPSCRRSTSARLTHRRWQTGCGWFARRRA